MICIFLIIQGVLLCLCFTAVIILRQIKDPASQIISYPTAIRKRVEGLSEYKGTIEQRKQKRLAVKVLAIFVVSLVLGLIAYFPGAKTFDKAFFHVFLLLFVVNHYDLFVLDIGFFCHSKKVVIKGREDMTAEYRNPVYHIGTVKGIGIGTAVGGDKVFIKKFWSSPIKAFGTGSSITAEIDEA